MEGTRPLAMPTGIAEQAWLDQPDEEDDRPQYQAFHFHHSSSSNSSSSSSSSSITTITTTFGDITKEDLSAEDAGPRIPTLRRRSSSTSSTSSRISAFHFGSVTDDELDSDSQLVLHVPPPQPRVASCSRPPCLKSTRLIFSAVASPIASTPMRFSNSLDSATTPSAPVYSFSAPRHFVAAAAAAALAQSKRQVHFDSSPPESFDTFSSDDYDRSQIECTQGGSEFDLRLPSKCKRYNGEGEEESECEDDSASETARSPPFGAHGSTGWAMLQRGAVIGSLGAGRSSLDAEMHSTDKPDSNCASLPVHGFRSFGGLSSGQRRVGHSLATDDGDDDTLEAPTVSVNDDDELESDSAAAFEAAVIASLPVKSPNATPKPSPSIIPRWARCVDYFGEQSETSSSSSATSSPSSKEGTPATSPAATADTSPPSQAPMLSPLNTVLSKTDSDQGSSSSVEHTPRMSATNGMSASPDSESPTISVMDLMISSNATIGPTDAPGSPAATRSRRPALPRSRQLEQRAEAVHVQTVGGACAPFAPCASPETEASPTFAVTHCEESDPRAFMVTQGSPSPMSSRCSSTDPWSGLSSSGDEGAHSPCGRWSSCTSPDMIPIGIAEGPATQLKLSPSESDVMLHQHVSAAGSMPATMAASGPPKSELSSALSLLEAELKMQPQPQLQHSGTTSTDEEMAWPPTVRSPSSLRSSSEEVKTRRKTSPGGSARSSFSEKEGSRPKPSRRKSASASSGQVGDEDSSGNTSPSNGDAPRRKSSKGGRVHRSHPSRSSSWACGGIEDEGALGGF